ncbi:TPA: GPW/gp25 family protein [Serratia fonticola]|nr:GPW/gp25 family protein [Serratia fonticola]
MNNAKYVGMDRATGRGLTDIDHIRQSVADILITPVGSRPMRRAYGSLLSELLDQPQNDVLHLHIMAAYYSAILLSRHHPG